MNNFEPSILGVLVIAISLADISTVLQVVLLVMTIVYTGYKILTITYQLNGIIGWRKLKCNNGCY